MDHVKGMTPGVELPNGQAPSNYPQKFVQAPTPPHNYTIMSARHVDSSSIMNAVLRAK